MILHKLVIADTIKFYAGLHEPECVKQKHIHS